MSVAPCHLPPSPLGGRYACVDLETTGADPAYARIIEVGIVLIDDGVIVERWGSLVDPERPIGERIQQVTGISNDMVRGAPTFVQLLDEIRERCRDRIFAAHNARFDLGFLRAEFVRAGRTFDAATLCTVKLSRRLEPADRRHNLDAVIERYGLCCTQRHRAVPDAQAVADFLLAAAAIHGARLQEEVERQLRPRTLPPQLPSAMLDDLPDGPGAFRFIDAAGDVLHVGRAMQMRAAVLAQLSAVRGGRVAQWQERVARIEWQRSTGEWSAHLLELLWRKQKQPQERFTLHLGNRGDALLVRRLGEAPLAECYGEFRTEALAMRVLQQLAAAHDLCLRVLGVEQGAGSCVAHQTDRCRGACVGKEPRIAHDMRAQLAFANLAFRPWPFNGPVAFTDAGHAAAAVHVFDEWCFLGTAADESELHELADQRTPPEFDLRIYRLTLSALEQNRIRARTLHAAH